MSIKKTKLSKYNLLILFGIFIIAAITYSMFFVKTNITASLGEEQLAYIDENNRFSFEIDPLTLKEDIPIRSGADGSGTLWYGIVWEDLGETGQMYCVQPGTNITAGTADGERIKYTPDRTYEELVAMKNATPPTGPVSGCSPHAPHVSTYHETSTTYFRCKGEHYIETDSFTDRHGTQYDNLYDIAFLLSWRQDRNFAINDWTRLKQLIVWDSILCQKDGFNLENDVRDITSTEISTIKILKLYAGGFITEDAYHDAWGAGAAYNYLAGYTPTGYQGVMENIKDNNDTMVKDGGATYDCNTMAINVDRQAQTIELGPFKIDYIDGRINAGDIAVGGISDMYLLDANNNKIEIDYIGYQNYRNGTTPKQIDWMEVDNDHKYNTFFSAIKPDGEGGVEYEGEENINKMDFWEYGKIYPDPNQEFYVKFSYANMTEIPKSVKLHAEFTWLECLVELCFRDGQIYYITDEHHHSGTHYHPATEHSPSYRHSHRTCRITPTIKSTHAQNQVYVANAERVYRHDEIDFEGCYDYIPLTMKLGGKVFEDAQAGKENVGNGTLGTEDRTLSNIKVTLYEVNSKTGQLELAKLATRKEEVPNVDQSEIDDKGDWSRRINPTITDDYGYYEFRGLDITKKYVVKYTYDGQSYMATQYLSTDGGNSSAYGSALAMANAGNYSSVTNNQYWELTSKGTELTNTNRDGEGREGRNSYTERFEEIGSEPKSYISTNSLQLGSQILTNDGGQWYNRTFTKYNLMGYTLTYEGKYTQLGMQLIDGYLYDQDGNLSYDANGKVTSKWEEGIISTEIKKFIDQNRKYPTDAELKQIYYDIANGDAEILQMIQFIEDTKISAFTKSQSANSASAYDQYPLRDQFTLWISGGNQYPNNSYSNGTYDENATQYSNNRYVLWGIFSKFVDANVTGATIHNKYHSLVQQVNQEQPYDNVYLGQLQINLGLAIRQESDVTLRKDLYRAVTQINGKTEVYKYDKRENEDADYWDIHLRVQDWANYYNTTYDRVLYPSDVDFTGQNGGDMLNIYVTYQIIVRNQSQTTVNQIMELVDYYDQDYTFVPGMSWVTLERRFDDDQYYDMMHYTGRAVGTIDDADSIDSSDSSRYGGITEYSIGNSYDAVYINGIDRYNLQSGDSAYVYVTFKVNGEGPNIELDTHPDDYKFNYVEINGYRTYYKDGTQLPNYGIKNETDSAGLIDRDSNAGNLVDTDLIPENGRYEHHFEDDTDRSKGLKITVDNSLIREANGVVWEDQRTTTIGNTDNSSDAIVGNGIRDNGEIPIAGVTVQLIEKCIDGTSEYVWQETTTDSKGRYSFSEFIPGDYVIRFKYGNTTSTLLTSEDGGANEVSYNGQDFKATLYQTGLDSNGNREGIDQDGGTDSLNRYYGYTNTAGQNVTGTYNRDKNTASAENTFGYDISKADTAGANYSDAKDLWTNRGRDDLQGRNEVISYSNQNVTNHKAEVLASPYDKPSYTDNLADRAGEETEYTADEMQALYQELMNETYMTAETGIIAVEFEYDRIQTDGYDDVANSAATGNNDMNGNYTLANIDFGLVERPKAQVEIDKSVANVQVTLINGTILFDINEAANNALWQDHKEYNLDEEKLDDGDHAVQGEEVGMYNEYYKENHRYFFRKEVDNLVTGTDKGIIQLTMDEELMHGATIQVTYTVKVTNVGEVDYVDGANKNFYYLGSTDGASISKTTVNQIVDYVQNNLQYDSNSNTDNGKVNNDNGWELITVQELLNNGLVNSRLESGDNNRLSQFNTILINKSDVLNKALVPGEETTRTLILSQMITPENTEDDLTYGNMVEIVQTSNDVGRKMAYSVVGNQDPLFEDASEVDTNIAERIIILTPFGEERIYYIVIAITAVILIIGIVLIRKFVLVKGKKK